MRTTTPLGVVVIFLTAALAGCVGTDPATPSGANDAADGAEATFDEAPLTVELRDCTEEYGVFTISASQAAPYLPDGFTPVGVDGAPLADGTAALAVLGLACEDAETGETVSQFWVDIPVEPPERYAKEGATFQYVHVIGVVEGAAMHDAYAAWGVPRMPEGEVQVDIPRDHLIVGDGATRAANGTTEALLTTTAVGPAQTLTAGTARLFGVEDGAVTAMVDSEFTPFTGSFGPAELEDDGLLPVTVDAPGAGGNFWGYDMTFWAAELPS